MKKIVNGWTIIATLLSIYAAYSLFTAHSDETIPAFLGAVLSMLILTVPFWWAAYRTYRQKRIYWLRTLAIVATIFFGLYVVYQITLPKTSEPQVSQIAQPPATQLGLHNEVNAVRSQNGIPALSLLDELNETAQIKCNDMASGNYFNHVNPSTGKNGGQLVLDKFTPRYRKGIMVLASENLAKTPVSSDKNVLDLWLNSAPHREAMLDARYDMVGYAICTAQDGETMFVQHFLGTKTIN